MLSLIVIKLSFSLLFSVWQQPYVNVFKHFNVPQWKKASKEGEVTPVMDKSVKATVFKITGHIPAGNYIQLPRTGSLGLTGRYFYLLFCPVPTKYFVVHVDVATQDSLVVRLSFSNLFKEFKSTATWLQFPFLCNPAKGSVAFYAAAAGVKGISGCLSVCECDECVCECVFSYAFSVVCQMPG
eukprot:GHVL01015563.1.p1 GENE.GHVL01015563.1~~GHVL01015563.1.p1  ORF type:complete len:183 (-),score=10.65 GHVL01015563.1:107-655(-)